MGRRPAPARPRRRGARDAPLRRRRDRHVRLGSRAPGAATARARVRGERRGGRAAAVRHAQPRRASYDRARRACRRRAGGLHPAPRARARGGPGARRPRRGAPAGRSGSAGAARARLAERDAVVRRPSRRLRGAAERLGAPGGPRPAPARARRRGPRKRGGRNGRARRRARPRRRAPPAHGSAHAHRPCARRPGVALAARRDPPQGAAHAVDGGRPARAPPRTSTSTSPPRSSTRGWRRTIRRSSSGWPGSPPAVASSRSAGCGSSPTASCRPGSRSCGSSSTASATSPSASAPITPSAGCPTASASPPPCRSCCAARASSASSRSSSPGRRRAASRTTSSSGRGSTAAASSRTCSTTPRAATTASTGPGAALATWRNARGREAHPESLLSIGYGDGGGGPTEEMLQRVAALDGFPALPAQSFGRVDAFFDRAQAADDLPVWSGELYLELHRGTLTTQGRTKRAHRRAERDLVAAETLASLDALAGGELPPSLEPAWRILLRNEFHDILPGSSIREVYEDAERELAEVSAAAETAIGEALGRLAARLDGDGPGILVVNPDSHRAPGPPPRPRSLTGGTLEGLEARVTSRGPPGVPVTASGRTLENDLVRVELAGDGTLASVHDKRVGREVLDGRGNQLWAYVDKPREWDAWELDVATPTRARRSPPARSRSSRTARTGPPCACTARSATRASPRTFASGRARPGSTSPPPRLARPPHPAQGALPARRPRPAGHVRDRVRRRRARHPPQHELGAGAVRGGRPPLRRSR